VQEETSYITLVFQATPVTIVTCSGCYLHGRMGRNRQLNQTYLSIKIYLKIGSEKDEMHQWQ